MFMTLSEQLQAVQLVSPSAVKAAVDACWHEFVSTSNCRQLVCRVAAVLSGVWGAGAGG